MIETDRLIVRLAEPMEVPEIVRYYRENHDHLQPFSPAFGGEQVDEAAWRDQVIERQLKLSRHESFRAFIFLRDLPHRIVGNINLTQVVGGAFQSCVLGYNLEAGAQGHGYMTEAVNATVRFAFSEFKLHRVAASYMPRNARSAAVLQRCGFRIEGTAPSYLRINGRWEDHVLTSIINPDTA